MPRVRILPAIRFTSYDHAEGDVVELSGEIAATWCNAGLAELVREDEPETPDQAADAKPETTAARSRGGRSRKSS